MSLFNSIPWKTIASFMPTVMELVRDTKSGDAGTAELRVKIGRLEQQQESLQAGYRTLLVWIVVTFLVALAALVIGIISLLR